MSSGNRVGRRQKPCFVFHFRQHDPYVSVPTGFDSPQKHFRRDFRRAVVVRIQQDQDASVFPGFPCRELDGPLQLVGPQYLVALDSDRQWELPADSRRHTFGDSPKQDGYGINLAVVFDNRRDRGHGSAVGTEQLGLLRRRVRELRVWSKLPHSEEFAGGIEVIPQRATADFVQWADTALAVLRDDGKD